MPVGPARMPLLDHLSELRRRLTIIVMCVLVTTLIIYMASPTLIQLLIDPIRQFMPAAGAQTRDLIPRKFWTSR